MRKMAEIIGFMRVVFREAGLIELRSRFMTRHYPIEHGWLCEKFVDTHIFMD